MFKMIKLHRKILIEERSFIIKNINEENLDLIVSYLFSNNVLIQNHKEIINSKLSHNDKCAEFLDILPRRGPNAFRHFLDALGTLQIRIIADRLMGRIDDSDLDFSSAISEGEPIVTATFTPVSEMLTDAHTMYALCLASESSDITDIEKIFKNAKVRIYRDTNNVPSGDYVPLILLFPENDDVTYLSIRDFYADKHALIFTTTDISVKGCHVFTGESREMIVEKLYNFLLIQRGKFSVKLLIDSLELEGTNNLSHYFNIDWPE